MPVPDHSYSEIQFNLANVLWGIPMSYGNNPAGVELRQGIAHLINKQSLVANNAACLNIACYSNDQAIPVCTTTTGCTNGGLPAANPCNWDTLFPENSSANCIVGAPSGTAYNCAYSTSCPTGIVTGGATFPWQPAIGSPDFCAAALHFIQAFKIQLGINVTQNSNCELLPPRGGWPSVVWTTNNVNCGGVLFATANVCFIVRNREPQRGLGEDIAQEICALFSPAWGAWTTLSSQPFSCDNSNTGSANPACGGGSCPFLEEVESVDNKQFYCAFTTSTTGIPNNCWGIGTFGFGQVFPFDSTTYFEYNSLFATKTDYTCVTPDCTLKTSGSTCASTTYTTSAANYMYVCSPAYDELSSAMEFSTCLSSPGPATDPSFSEASPTFANCSGAAVSGGAGAITCMSATPTCSAISAGYQAEDYYGSHVLTLPIYDTIDIQGRLSSWPLGGSIPGFITAMGGGYSATANFWNWLNAYTSNPAVPGTLRQSFLTTVDNLNPFQFTTIWDGYVLGNIYDSLFQENPLCGPPSPAGHVGPPPCNSIFQIMDWMTTSHSFLCYPNGPSCTATTLGYGNSTYFAGTTADLRLFLNRSNHWHDGGPVTAWDVKYSFINLNATGAFQASSLSTIAHINVLDEYTLDLNLKAKGPFTDYSIGAVTIIPGHVWTSCSANMWASFLASKNLEGGNIVNAAEDSCVGTFASPNIVTVGGVRADSLSFDPMAHNFIIGSGPYTCQSIGGTGHPAVGTIGGGCSVDNTSYPAFGLNDFTLTRTGCTLTSTGTTCGTAGSSGDYFRSSGALATYIWTGDIGSGSADFSKVLMVNSCHSSSPSPNCPHWAQGIGNPGGTGNNPVGLSQRLKVNFQKGISWINFATPQSSGSLGVLTCAAGYTLPQTTVVPCTSASAGWASSVLPGIGNYASTLYEVGSQITIGTTTTSTSTLSPASVIGCATAYPNGGYDC